MVTVACAVNVNAQSWLGKLKEKAIDKVKEKVEKKVEDKAGSVADDILDGKKSDKKRSKDDEVNGVEGTKEANPAAGTSSDFKRGEVILFEDDLKGETVGEFPSKWDLFQGTVETKTLGGVRAINLTDNAQVQPLIREQGPICRRSSRLSTTSTIGTRRMTWA